MVFFKYLFFTVVLYVVLIFSTYKVYFKDISSSIINEQNLIYKYTFNQFVNNVEDYVLNNQFSKVSDEIDKVSKNNQFLYIKMKYTKYYVSTKSILLHSDITLSDSWYLNDVSIDDKFGHIKQVNTLIYEILPVNKNIFKKEIVLKSQATDQRVIQNIISTLQYKLKNYSNQTVNKENWDLKLLKKYLAIPNSEKSIKLYVNKINDYAKITYKFNNELLYKQILSHINNYLFFISIIFAILIILIFLFNYIIVQSTINMYLKKLNKYTSDVLNNNFYKFNSKQLVYKDIKNVSKDISLISKKMASIINEININKNILEKKISSDPLTSLPNTKMFGHDIKTLFLLKTKSYIIKIKLECLYEFVKNESNARTDNLILTFVTAVNNTIANTPNSDNISLYRFYGADFVVIYNNSDYELINKFLEDLKLNMNNSLNSFQLSNKIVHCVAFPFDKFSNIDTILEKSNKIYSDTVNIEDSISYYNENNIELEKKNDELQKVIVSIINTNSFTLSYKFDTHSYDDDSLIMQEVSANLINYDGSPIPIGTFIAVAEDNDLAIEFDKKLIIKTFEYIKNKKIDHILAINISIDALKNDEFIFWLETQLLFEYKEQLDNVIFSVTSFAAKNFFSEFLYFTNQIKKFDSKILLKRFSYDDFSLDKLEKLNLDYVRVHKDYTNNIDKHKRSVLNNIKNYCLNHDINLLGDVVNNDHDNDILKSLNFNGTSK